MRLPPVSILEGEIDLNLIQQIMYWSLIGVTILIGVIFLIALLRALFRHWKYGTYRLISYGIVIAACLLSLKALTGLVGQLDMRTFGLGFLFEFEATEGNMVRLEFTAENPTLFGGLTSFISDLAKAYDANIDPEMLTSYAMAVATSTVAYVLLIVEGILLLTVFAFLIWLFWHILWKHILIKKAVRKDKKKKHAGRWISVLEEAVVCAACILMVVSPYSSLMNSLAYSWDSVSQTSREKNLRRADNETVQMIDTIVSNYTDSVFAKVFFDWNKNAETGETFDQTLVSYFTGAKASDENEPIDFVSTIRDFSSIASILTQGGMVLSDGISESERIVFLLTSQYIPMLLNKLGDTALVTNLLPVAMGIIANLPALREYLGVDCGLDFSGNYKDTFHTMANIYQKLLDAPAVGRMFDENGEPKPLGDGVTGFFSQDSYDNVHEVLSSLDGESMKFLNTLLRAVLLNRAVAAKKAIAEDPSLADEISILDFLPDLGPNWDANGNGVADEIPNSYMEIRIGSEFLVIYDCFHRLYSIDPRFLTSFTDSWNKTEEDTSSPSGRKRADDEGFASSDSMEGFFDALLSHLGEVGGIFYETTDTHACLLDSIFLQNGGPRLIEFVGNAMNDGLGLEGEDAIQIDSVVDYLQADGDVAMRKTRLKSEFSGVFTVLGKLTGSAEGGNFIRHLSSKPGIYSNEEDTMLGMSDGLLDCLIEATRALDQSRLMSAVLEKMTTAMLSAGGFFGDNMRFGTDSAHLGRDLASMLEAFKENQNVILYLTTVGSKLGSGSSYVMSGFADSYFQTQLGNFLVAYLNNGYFNPVWDAGTPQELHNGNISGLMEMLFGTVLGDDYKKDEVRAIIAGADEDDMRDLARAIGTFASSDAISSLTGGSLDLGGLANISFEELFGAIGSSKILKAIFAPIINEKVLSNASMVSGDSVQLQMGADADWATEGKVIDAIVGFAAKHGDFANIDFLNSEPSAITGILKALAGSQLFANKDPMDTTYPFSNFISEKMVSSFASAGPAASFFVNFGVDTSLPSFEESHFSEFKAACRSVASKEEWATEIDAIGEILSGVNSIGGFSGFNSGNLTTFSAKSLREMLHASESSKVFGKFIIYHLHEKLVDMLANAQPSFGNANVAYLGANGRTLDEIRYEDERLIDLLEFILNPSGRDGGGEKTYTLLNDSGAFGAGNFSLFGSGSMSGKTIQDLLIPLARSHIYNGAVATGLTAFEKEISTMLYSSSIYGSGVSQEQVDGYIQAIAAGAANDQERFAIWESEIAILAQMVDEFSALGLSFSGSGMSFDDLLGDGVDQPTRRANAAKIEKLLLDFNESSCLYRALPIQIENAMQNAGLKDVDLFGGTLDFNLVHFHYTGDARYHRAELRNFVNIFYNYYQLGHPTSITPADASDPTKQEVVKQLLADMRYDKIIGEAFDALFPDAEPNVADYGGNPLDPDYLSAVALWTIWTMLPPYEPTYLQVIV